MRLKLNLLAVSILVLISIFLMAKIAAKEHYVGRISALFDKQKIENTALYDVVYVYDGDTIAVNMLGNIEKVRLIGVDTPETHDPDTPLQCFGNEASNYSKENLLNKKVRLEADPLNQNRDRYERLLRYVYIDSSLWNKKLIEGGYAFAYLRYPFSKLDEFKNIESIARENNTGLWSKCTPKIYKGTYQSNAETSATK